MLKEVLLPDLGEGIESADVSEILVSAGDSVSIDDIFLVLESDKASMEIPAENNGKVKEVFVKAGDKVKTGSPLISLEVSSDVEPSIKSENKENKENKEEPTFKKKEVKIEDKPERSSDKTFASPGVRKLSRELDIDLSGVSATGLKGRITKEDLHKYIKLKMSQGGGFSAQNFPKVDFSKWGNIEEKPLTKIQKITGERLQQAWQIIPHVTQFDEADISILNSIREKEKEEGLKNNIKVTFLPFIIIAAIKALKEFPVFNSSLNHNQDSLIIKKYYNIGIAIDTPTGLVVPVIKGADKKSILDLSKELMDLSDRARNKKLKPEELSGGSFTISSLGGIGGTNFTPIINPPEVAIMGISKSVWKPVYNNKTKEIIPTLTMPFSLSYDHRVIDGAIGASFTSFFASTVLEGSIFK